VDGEMGPKKVGVLALQGAFIEHIIALRCLNVEAVLVRLPKQLEGLDGLIIPGGESTTMIRLMQSYGFVKPIKEFAKAGKPIWGTCAGMILMAAQLSGANGKALGLMDIEVKRNAFGRQVDSFEVDLSMPALGKDNFRAIFIRAPMIEKVGSGVEVLAKLEEGVVVAARQKNLLVCAFHPELSNDLRFHDYFIQMIEHNDCECQ
jgi:pyridoxal 5'-phosphate synthase pdxT subunit